MKLLDFQIYDKFNCLVWNQSANKIVIGVE